MIKMVIWRTGGHQTPLIGFWTCRSASSISMATSPGTWPMDFMYVLVDNLSLLLLSLSFYIIYFFSNIVPNFANLFAFLLILPAYPFSYFSQFCRLISSLLQLPLIFSVDISIPLPLFVSLPLSYCFELCFFYPLGQCFLVHVSQKSDICDLLKYGGKKYHLPLSFFPAYLCVFSTYIPVKW